MLIEFRVRNHRSLLSEQVLSLEASSRGGDDNRARKAPGAHQHLLPVIAIYGGNASGKSNVLSAFAFMQSAVAFSHRLWEPEGGIPRDPYAWGSHSIEPSLFEVRFVFAGVRYQYGFVVDDERCVEEWLYAWPHNRKQMWFERDGSQFKFGEHLHGENRLVEDVTRPNALFLSAAAQHHHKQLTPVYTWFRRVMAINIPRYRGEMDRAHLEFSLSRMLAGDSRNRQQALLFDEDGAKRDNTLDMLREMLRVADVGIVDLKVDGGGDESFRGRRRSRVFVNHRFSGGDAWLPLQEESNGTRTLLQLASPILQTLKHGGVLLVDELESSLHPLLAAYIVRQFNDSTANPNGAQIIFTTHDTNLLGTTLGPPLLRRDQVWLAEKDNNGTSCLYPLSDYKPRKVENLERGYLQGRYGAIPFLGTLGQITSDGA